VEERGRRNGGPRGEMLGCVHMGEGVRGGGKGKVSS
jgi:hypothetical protein